MGGYFMVAAVFLAAFCDIKHKLTARLLACEFFLLWAIHYFGHEVFGVLGMPASQQGGWVFGEPELYLTYILVQMPVLFFMWLTHCSLYVRSLITLTLLYNVLTISQYSFNVIDFYGGYKIFMQVIMALQLIYLVWVTGYVSNYRRSKRPNYIADSSRLFNIRPRLGSGS